MGSLHAMEFAEAVATKQLKLRIALEQHLQYNHYPPIPLSMVDPCMRAIKYANRGEWNKRVRLPKGVTYRDKTLAPVSVMIEQHHLDWLLDQEED